MQPRTSVIKEKIFVLANARIAHLLGRAPLRQYTGRIQQAMSTASPGSQPIMWAARPSEKNAAFKKANWVTPRDGRPRAADRPLVRTLLPRHPETPTARAAGDSGCKILTGAGHPRTRLARAAPSLGVRWQASTSRVYTFPEEWAASLTGWPAYVGWPGLQSWAPVLQALLGDAHDQAVSYRLQSACCPP